MTADIWCFGDSITYGTWLANPGTESWPGQLDTLLGGGRVRNLGVGGQAVTYADPGGESMVAFCRRVITSTAVSERPATIIFAGGINDMVRATDVSPTRFAVYELGGWLGTNSPGTRFLVSTITPYRGGAQYAAPLSERRATYNTWVRDMYGQSGQLMDTGDLLTAGATYADVRYYLDTLHPNARGAGVLADGMHSLLKEKGIV